MPGIKTHTLNRMASGLKITPLFLLLGVILIFAVGYVLGKVRGKVVLEKFESGSTCNRCGKTPCGCAKAAMSGLDMPPAPDWPSTAEMSGVCDRCHKPRPCGCASGGVDAGSNSSPTGMPYAPRERCPPCPSCPTPDMSKWMKKSAVPPCPPLPDMSKYMLKTECPPLPDMSKYVLKSSVPKCPPCISTCSKPCKIGECPPCPRPSCPVVKCPEPKACPACPAAQCAPCPEPDIQCKANYMQTNPVRPMLASTASFGL